MAQVDEYECACPEQNLDTHSEDCPEYQTAATWLRVRQGWLHVEQVQRSDGAWAIVLVLDEGYSEARPEMLEYHQLEFLRVVNTEGLEPSGYNWPEGDRP
ncbi:hypothetical protein [Rhodococcus qingshengii]|uniref:hypothetical protein n=1 Tax=Rhodococcus qingshengii TaxID=334542 RepID=UPI002AFEEFA0|nr:hypothetical protein [Rhodococcus qingshengii]MEA1798684.1 hypothetical protein [Rhodococcus qingshengii]